ncbi:hypothetical protein U1Q18_007632 [Sarracenia purpurea var. burkii]
MVASRGVMEQGHQCWSSGRHGVAVRRTTKLGTVSGRDCCVKEVRCAKVWSGGVGCIVQGLCPDDEHCAKVKHDWLAQWQQESSDGGRSTTSCSGVAVRESDGSAGAMVSRRKSL